MKYVKEKRMVVNDLVRFFNAETFHETGFGNIVYSEGVKRIIEKWECMWFIDIIIAFQTYPRFQGESFQIWKLERVEKERFLITSTNKEGKKLCFRNMPFSDFMADEMTLWMIDKKILLPTER